MEFYDHKFEEKLKIQIGLKRIILFLHFLSCHLPSEAWKREGEEWRERK